MANFKWDTRHFKFAIPHFPFEIVLSFHLLVIPAKGAKNVN